MDWLLIFWIRGCAGLDCDIPSYERKLFKTEPECHAALEFWVKTSPQAKKKTSFIDGRKLTYTDRTGQHLGICIEQG